MQNITYINAYGERLDFTGMPPVLLRSVSGLSRPDAQVVSVQGAYQAGGIICRMQLPMRRIEVRFDLLPQESRTAFYERRMHMERVLSASRCMRDGKTGLLIYENDAGRWQTQAVPEGSIAYGKRVGHAAADNRVTFVCPNPYLFGGEAETAQLRMNVKGIRLPFKLPVKLGMRRFSAELVNLGTVDAPATITIFGTGEMPMLTNHTTGARIAVSRQVATDERLVIHTDPAALSCRIVHTDGTSEDAFGYLDPSAAVSAFTLIPGINSVEYLPGTVSAGSRVEIEWRSCYEGV